MNNAPPAARMPAACMQALLSIRPGGQRLAAREVLAGRDRLERLAPGTVNASHKRRPVKPFRDGGGFAPESPIWTPCTGVAPKQTSSTESATCALTVRDVRDAAWLPHSMASAAMGFELTETAGTPCVEAGMPAP